MNFGFTHTRTAGCPILAVILSEVDEFAFCNPDSRLGYHEPEPNPAPLKLKAES
jgi:hypothetical protein